MNYGLTQIEAPTGDVLTLREIKAHVNQADVITKDDVLLMTIAARAVNEFEDFTNRALLTQRWVMTLDSWPPAITLPRNPVQRVELVEYLDSQNTWREVDVATYCLVRDREPAILQLAHGKQWPTASLAGVRGRIRIQYVTGYGVASAVPLEVKGCLLERIETKYRFRGQGEIPDDSLVAWEHWRVADDFSHYGIGTARGVADDYATRSGGTTARNYY